MRERKRDMCMYVYTRVYVDLYMCICEIGTSCKKGLMYGYV